MKSPGRREEDTIGFPRARLWERREAGSQCFQSSHSETTEMANARENLV